MVDAASDAGETARSDLKRIFMDNRRRGVVTTVTATPKPQQSPIISEVLTAPGEPPKPPKPVPDCTGWRYFVERWELISSVSEAYSIPVITGYDTITMNFGGFTTSYQMPRIVNVPATRYSFTFEWVADEYNGCGTKLSTHRSGVTHTSSSMMTNSGIAQAILSNDAQVRQIEMWNTALLDRANAAGKQAIASSPTTSGIQSGAFSTAEQGLQAVQADIEAAMRDYAYTLDLYNKQLEEHQQSVSNYENAKRAQEAYNEQVELVSNMIREDKVGTAYTVKGAGNKAVSLTVGQEISGAQLISSGIQSIGSGHNIDPAATYIITDVNLTYDTPRVNVPGLQGISYPGRIVITK